MHHAMCTMHHVKWIRRPEGYFQCDVFTSVCAWARAVFAISRCVAAASSPIFANCPPSENKNGKGRSINVFVCLLASCGIIAHPRGRDVVIMITLTVTMMRHRQSACVCAFMHVRVRVRSRSCVRRRVRVYLRARVCVYHLLRADEERRNWQAVFVRFGRKVEGVTRRNGFELRQIDAKPAQLNGAAVAAADCSNATQRLHRRLLSKSIQPGRQRNAAFWAVAHVLLTVGLVPTTKTDEDSR
jgi:hypothetical protein